MDRSVSAPDFPLYLRAAEIEAWHAYEKAEMDGSGRRWHTRAEAAAAWEGVGRELRELVEDVRSVFVCWRR